MTEVETAWLAGLFEGEGCIVIRSDRDRSDGVFLVVNMTDDDVIRRAHSISGVGTVTGPVWHKLSTKPIWRWAVYRRDAVVSILEAMLPYLGERRNERACEALSYLFIRQAA